MDAVGDPQGGATSSPADNFEAGRFRILFVCTANICRSPLAQYLLLIQLGQGAAATRFRVSSAGTHGANGMLMDPGAAAQLHRLGGDSRAFRSTALTDPACNDADLILTATRGHRSLVLDRVPRVLRRTFTVLEFADIVSNHQCVTRSLTTLVSAAAAARGATRLENYDVADPYGGTSEDHRRAADALHGAINVIGPRLMTLG